MNAEAEARLRGLALLVLKESGYPLTEDLTLIQAFMAHGFTETEPQEVEMSFRKIVDTFSFPGWLLSLVFPKMKTFIENIMEKEKYHRERRRAEMEPYTEEVYLRNKIVQQTMRNLDQERWKESQEAKKIRDEAGRAASKIRENTIDQLRELLQLANIRILQEQLKFAKEANLVDEQIALAGQIALKYKEALDKLREISKLVEANQNLDVLLAEPLKKPGNPKSRNRRR